MLTMSDKFWSKVEVKSKDECWIWKGAPDGSGYSSVMIDGIRMGAHRMSYILNFGEIPDRLWVLHRCDVKLCVNPYHLFLGTPKENSDDMVQKSRSARGGRSGAHLLSKLSEDDIRKIRQMQGSQYSIAKFFGVNQSTISRIKSGKRWEWA